MVQVGCTINYVRSCLWKQTEESARVDYPCNVGENDSAITRSPSCLVGPRVFCCNRGPVAQLGARFHGMEEVVGSIPTRSTKSLNNLDWTSGYPRPRLSHGLCHNPPFWCSPREFPSHCAWLPFGHDCTAPTCDG